MTETLPTGWLTSGIHDRFWQFEDTSYGFVPFDDLPPLAGSFDDADFGWLPERPPDDYPLDFLHEHEVGARLRHVEQSAAAGLQMPAAFMRFLSSADIYRRVPTCTACYLDIPKRTIELAGHPDVKLLRFMNDQQGVLHWYLRLKNGSPPCVVVAVPEWHDLRGGDALEDVMTPTLVTICAHSFTEFVYRFWLENTIWFSLYEGRELTDDQEAYRSAAASRVFEGGE